MSNVRYGGTPGSIYIEKKAAPAKAKKVAEVKKEMEALPPLAPEVEADLKELAALGELQGYDEGFEENPLIKSNKKKKKISKDEE